MPQPSTIEPEVNMMKMHHIINQSIIEPEPVGRMATAEELEMFRRAEENLRNGNYYAQRDGETVREFTERIMKED